MFIDELDIHIRAGNGGDGVVRWQKEKGKAMMGPAGGDGGNGGSVFVMGVHDSSLLYKYRHLKKFEAQDGEHGRKSSEYGAHGEDLIIKLPLGSVVTNLSTKEVVEVLENGEQYEILKGGKGGYGNEGFKSSSNQTPLESTDGKPGGAANFHVELKVIADVGLVGFPNAGKSSLINELTRADSKVGSYEFTTLDPHLGTHYGIIIADIPGLIEGASDGKGLGTKFLKHIARTGMILHCVSVESDDVVKQYKAIRNELETFDKALGEKKEIVLLTKTDLLSEEEVEEKINQLKKYSPDVYAYSFIDDESVQAVSKLLVSCFKSGDKLKDN